MFTECVFTECMQNASGLPYILFSVTPDFTFGMVDLTNEAAVAWYADVIRSNMLAIDTVVLHCGVLVC